MKKTILILLLVLSLSSCFASSIIFIAHSDDEIIGTTHVLAREENVTIVLFTDGTPKEYNLTIEDEELRRNEHNRALSLLNSSVELIELGFDDLNFYADLGPIGLFNTILNISKYISNNCADNLYVHAFEGGHIDHDTVNFIVAKAYELSNCSNPLYEFVEYNKLGWGVPLYEDFEQIELSNDELLLKQNMLSCFISQEVYSNCSINDYTNLTHDCRDSILNTYYFEDEWIREIGNYNYFNDNLDFSLTLLLTTWLFNLNNYISFIILLILVVIVFKKLK